MGRRKKVPASVHRKSIAAAAQKLFAKKGIDATSMDDIAREAGYSKATLYVYFKNKEDIAGVLVLESMKKLYDFISLALKEHTGTKETYDAVCASLIDYQEQYPFYFYVVFEKMSVNMDSPDCLPVEKEILEVGNQINLAVADFLRASMASGEIRPDIPIPPTVFSFWAMLFGLIQLSSNKKTYIEKSMDLSRKEFLNYGFDMLYHLIAAKRL